MLAEWFKVNYMIHEGEMRSRKERSHIKAVAKVFNWVQEA